MRRSGLANRLAHLVSHHPELLALTALAALIRFVSLDVQSFEYDELVTARLVGLGLGDMLKLIPHSESTPPAYYVLAWGWSRLFGDGEIGLRCLSALLGTAAVPVAYSAAATLVSRRAAVIAAALVAVSPWLIWYSQQARSYALAVVLGGLSFVFFARSLDEPRSRTLAGWALSSGLALATHYFALFLVVPEAVWLLLATRARRSVIVASCAVAAAGAALLPLALLQQSGGQGEEMIAGSGSLLLRLLQLPKQSMVGYDAPAELPAAVAVIGLTAFSVVLLLRYAGRCERHGALIAAAIGAATVAVPIVLAVAGLDYLVSRNLIVAWIPLAAVIAAGFGASGAPRAGAAGAITVCALFAGVAAGVALDPSLQRDDWRGAAQALGDPTRDRAIVVTPEVKPAVLAVYTPGVERLPRRGARVREVDLLGIATVDPHAGVGRRTPRPEVVAPPAPRLSQVGSRYGETFTVVRFRSREPVRVTPSELRGHALEQREGTTVLLQRRGG